jgi:hypothetical protein
MPRVPQLKGISRGQTGTPTSTWTRTADGYTRDGWTIRRTHSRGSGQAKPFQHVNAKAFDAWIVCDPEGFNRTGSATFAGAKLNADRQIAIRTETTLADHFAQALEIVK